MLFFQQVQPYAYQKPLYSEFDISEIQLMALEAKVNEISLRDKHPDHATMSEQAQAIEYFNKKLSLNNKDTQWEPSINRGMTESPQNTTKLMK